MSAATAATVTTLLVLGLSASSLVATAVARPVFEPFRGHDGLQARLPDTPGASISHAFRHVDALGRETHLTYTATPHPDTYLLDTDTRVEAVACGTGSVTIVFRNHLDAAEHGWAEGTMLVGGREWGCTELDDTTPDDEADTRVTSVMRRVTGVTSVDGTLVTLATEPISHKHVLQDANVVFRTNHFTAGDVDLRDDDVEVGVDADAAAAPADGDGGDSADGNSDGAGQRGRQLGILHHLSHAVSHAAHSVGHAVSKGAHAVGHAVDSGVHSVVSGVKHLAASVVSTLKALFTGDFHFSDDVSWVVGSFLLRVFALR